MATFTLTQLNNRPGEVVESAYEGPVEITSRGKRKFVLMTAAQFDRFAGKSTQRSYHVEDLTDGERHEFIAALDAVAAGREHVDE